MWLCTWMCTVQIACTNHNFQLPDFQLLQQTHLLQGNDVLRFFVAVGYEFSYKSAAVCTSYSWFYNIYTPLSELTL